MSEVDDAYDRLRGAIVLELALVRWSGFGGPMVSCVSLLPGGADHLSNWCVSGTEDVAASAMSRLYACGAAFFHAADLGVAPVAFPAKAHRWMPRRHTADPRLRVLLQRSTIKVTAWVLECWDGGVVHYVNNPRDHAPWDGQHLIEDLRPRVHDWAELAMAHDTEVHGP